MPGELLNRIIWITGLSGAGKTSVAFSLKSHLNLMGYQVAHIDGDEIREAFSSIKTMSKYDRASRIANAYIYSDLAYLLSKQNDFTILSTISMFTEIYQYNRQKFNKYCEVFLNSSEEIRRARDPKNFYKNLDQEQLSNFCGHQIEIDIPKLAHLTVESEKEQTPELIANRIAMFQEKHFASTKETFK